MNVQYIYGMQKSKTPGQDCGPQEVSGSGLDTVSNKMMGTLSPNNYIMVINTAQ